MTGCCSPCNQPGPRPAANRSAGAGRATPRRASCPLPPMETQTLFIEAIPSPSEQPGAIPRFVRIELEAGLVAALRGLRTRCQDFRLDYVGIAVAPSYWGIDPASSTGQSCTTSLEVTERDFRFVLDLGTERYVSAMICHDELPQLLRERAREVYFAQGPDVELRAAVQQARQAARACSPADESANDAVR